MKVAIELLHATASHSSVCGCLEVQPLPEGRFESNGIDNILFLFIISSINFREVKMRLSKISVGMLMYVLFAVSLVAQEGASEVVLDSVQTYEPYAASQYIELNEWTGGVGGSLIGTFTPLTFYPIAYFIPLDGPPGFLVDDDPLGSIAPLWPAYIAAPLGSAAAVYFYGRLKKDGGSAVGAFLGAALGEATWLGVYFGTRKLFPESVLAAQAAYFSMPLVIGSGTFAGYHLIPGTAKGNSSSFGLMLGPGFDGEGVGVAVSLRF